MKNNTQTLFVAIGLLAISAAPARALSPEAARILSKQNRRLEAPPHALRASEANVDLRYASGQRRLAAQRNDDSNDLETIPVTNPKDYLNTLGNKLGGSLGFDYDAESRSKLDRVFGLGFVSAGAYGVFGAELDFSLLDEWTFGFGLGTGMDYASWSLHSRYLFRKSSATTPFVELGYANWRLDRVSARNNGIAPGHLTERFFSDDNRAAHIFYPGFGINYMMASGMSVIAQAQYMINLRDFVGGLTASAGIYYYF